ncbi:MAG: hypothetical protein B1H04_00830 [Planctomycetales bacterium 4484_123]|nr:MAG: hypothetical protein B1H04_00830 [Planctomycetales bacterium 4484_123]
MVKWSPTGHRVVRGIGVILAGAGVWLAGCGPVNEQYVGPARLEHGLVIILPGIEGEGPLSYSVRQGLLDADIQAALPIYRWGRPVPLAGPLLNQMDEQGNRLAAGRIARMIVDYQDTHPGRPVHLVGHSGGGGVAVFAAEALPPGRQVEGLVLLSASISSGYDLSKALAHCRKGIVNFYSKGDVGFLVLGTTVFGNVDGVRGPAAGAVGFKYPRPGLYQVGWRAEMAGSGHLGGHAGTTASGFVERYVVPWIRAASWPVQ